MATITQLITQPTIRTLADVEQTTIASSTIGYTVFWRLTGIEITHTDLKAALVKVGFEAFLPKPPTPRKALRRALEEWIRDRGDSTSESVASRVLIRIINNKRSEYMVFCLVGEDADFQTLNLNYGTNLRILLHKKQGDIIVTAQKSGEIMPSHQDATIAAEIKPYWDKYKNLLFSGDLSRMMREVIGSFKAVTLRKEGGLYFVPETHSADLEVVRTLIDDMSDNRAYLAMLGVPRTTKKGLGKAVYVAMSDEIATCEKDLQRFLDADPKTVKNKTIVERLTTYRALQGKINTYCDLLEIRRENLLEGVDALRAAARSLLLRDTEDENTEDDTDNQALTETPVSAVQEPLPF